MNEDIYFAIIGDIISSKKITDRNKIQKELKDVMAGINRQYADEIASDFVITLGDEFQGLLKSATLLLEILDRIKFELEPIEIRFGIGIGRIETEINRKSSVGADGPAYWCARRAINIIHSNNDYNISKVAVEIENEKFADVVNLINESLHVCDYMEKHWRKTQKTLIKESVLRFGHDTKIPQKELAVLLNTSAPALNLRIQSSGYYNYLRTKKSICDVLQKIGNE
ncbi:SatD family protein [Methanolapillus millepedarum]